MTFAGKLTRVYFDVVYNRVYDFTTGRLNRYRRLQRMCVGKLGLKNHDKVLCVGLGTGNEVLHILRIWLLRANGHGETTILNYPSLSQDALWRYKWVKVRTVKYRGQPVGF